MLRPNQACYAVVTPNTEYFCYLARYLEAIVAGQLQALQTDYLEACYDEYTLKALSLLPQAVWPSGLCGPRLQVQALIS